MHRKLLASVAALVLAAIASGQGPSTKAGQTLAVGVPLLPENLSPALANSEIERHAIGLIFDRLIEPRRSKGVLRYEENLLTRPPGLGVSPSRLDLVRDAVFSNGDRFAAGDVRHTLQLLLRPEMARRQPYWAEVLESSRWDGEPFYLDWFWRRQPFDPLRAFTMPILPQQYRGKPLERADDPAFAKQPVGTGPFQLQAVRSEEVVLAANPHYVREKPTGNVGEVRFVPLKSKATLLFDPPWSMEAEIKKANYQLQPVEPRVYILALNHRRAPLQNLSLRRFLAHSWDPKEIGPLVAPAWELHPVNGPFQLRSWANAPASRAKTEMYQLLFAKSLAKIAGKELGSVSLNLLLPDPRWEPVAQNLIEQWQSVAKSAGFELTVKLSETPAAQFHRTLDKRDFDLALCQLPGQAEVWDLWTLLNPSAGASQPGGSNFLGYENDPRLHALLRQLFQHGQFSAFQETAHDLHVHLLDQMPFAPLWQVNLMIAHGSSLTTGQIDQGDVFATIGQWRVR